MVHSDGYEVHSANYFLLMFVLYILQCLNTKLITNNRNTTLRLLNV